MWIIIKKLKVVEQARINEINYNLIISDIIKKPPIYSILKGEKLYLNNRNINL